MRHLWLTAFVFVGCGLGCGPGMRRIADLPRCRVARAASRPDCAPPSVSGTVVAAATGAPIAGVEVRVGDGTSRTTTGPDGAFALCGLAASPVGRGLAFGYRDGRAEATLDGATTVVAAEVREERWPTFIDPTSKRPRRGPDERISRLALCIPMGKQ